MLANITYMIKIAAKYRKNARQQLVYYVPVYVHVYVCVYIHIRLKNMVLVKCARTNNWKNTLKIFFLRGSVIPFPVVFATGKLQQELGITIIISPFYHKNT
jgi:hypothetical protein